ncbi:Protein FLC EXPRESSOR [Morella rubra]|uniref:Protein FLC EXPRESSOR n=1 Tax=Morella rubra TaxID=262757 RepID=A0A6A1UR29_9ROSI|nr:Protein FLC EXPRESSOR [Morella rubra]
MAGRDYLTPRLREIRIDDPRLLHHHRGLYQPSTSTSTSSRYHHPGSVLLEDRIAIQHREIQSLLDENQRLASTHVALKHDLRDAQLELRHASAKAADVKAESDAQARDFYQRSLEMETEVRVIDAMSAELAQVRADVHKLFSSRQELAAQLQAIEDDLARARSESLEVPPIKSEIESLRREIQRGRAAIENEKKTRASNLEHRRAMGRYMSSMAQELVKLQAELASAEKRAADAAAAPAAANPSTGYAASYGNPDMAYGGNSYPDPYGMNQACILP